MSARHNAETGPWLALVVLVLAGCGSEGSRPGRAVEAVPVRVATAVRKAMPLQLRAVGTVEAYATVSVTARVGGILTGVHFEQGRDVQAGDLLFEIDSRPYRTSLAEAESRLARDRALAAKAVEDVRRYTALVEKEYVTREQFETARANAEALQGSVQADEAVVESARLQLSYCTIRAPLSGRTGSLLVNAGNQVRSNDPTPLVVILQTRPIRVAFSVSEKHLDTVRARAAAAPLQVAVRPRGAAQDVVGKLEFIDNAVERMTGTILLKAVFDNEDGRLWPGQFGDVVLTLEEQSDALVVPSTAVQAGQQGTYAFVVRGDGTVESRTVVVDRVAGVETVVAGGVDAGERVVVDGQLRLVPGVKVSISESSATPGGDPRTPGGPASAQARDSRAP